MMTCQILYQKNNLDIEKTVDSISCLGAEIIIGDLTGKFKTDKCLVYNFQGYTNLSDVRNRIVKESNCEWQLMLHPGEVITDKVDVVNVMNNDPSSYMLSILRGNVVTYETRLWHKSLSLEFKNPVCEYLPTDNAKFLDVIIYNNSNTFIDFNLLSRWRQDQPHSNEISYYEALYYLSLCDWKMFLNKASHYLFIDNSTNKHTTMLRYYLSIVNCHIAKNLQQAIHDICQCILVNPLMAEFWCLLGDIYMLMSKYEEAKAFFDNAIILGNKRDIKDKWPIDLTKYHEYPMQMIEKCNIAEKSSKYVKKF